MSRALLLVFVAALWASRPAAGEVIKIGYLTAIQGESEKLGLTISGAMSLAVRDINADPNLLPGHTLEFRYNDTEGDTKKGTRALVEMICDDTVAFFGPQDECLYEAHVAGSFNLPMISYVSTDWPAVTLPDPVMTP